MMLLGDALVVQVLQREKENAAEKKRCRGIETGQVVKQSKAERVEKCIRSANGLRPLIVSQKRERHCFFAVAFPDRPTMADADCYTDCSRLPARRSGCGRCATASPSVPELMVCIGANLLDSASGLFMAVDEAKRKHIQSARGVEVENAFEARNAVVAEEDPACSLQSRSTDAWIALGGL